MHLLTNFILIRHDWVRALHEVVFPLIAMSLSEWISVKERLPEQVGEEAIVVGSSELGPEPYITLVEYLGDGY